MSIAVFCRTPLRLPEAELDPSEIHHPSPEPTRNNPEPILFTLRNLFCERFAAVLCSGSSVVCTDLADETVLVGARGTIWVCVGDASVEEMRGRKGVRKEAEGRKRSCVSQLIDERVRQIRTRVVRTSDDTNVDT